MNRQLFLLIGLVPLFGILSQWLAWRFKVPAIVFLLLMGLGLGQWVSIDQTLLAVTGVQDPSVPAQLLFPLISLSVAVIMFEGGMSLKISELQEAGGSVLRLTTVCVLLSWGLTTAALYWVLGLHLHLAALLGAIFVVTGPTVVAPLLRNIRPIPKVASMVKWEGIVVDPIGAVLAVLVLEQMRLASTGEYPIATAVWTLVATCAVGLIIGLLAAAVLTVVLARYWVPDYLHAVLILAVVMATFAISHWLRPESGLITVTVLGIAMANQRLVSVRHIIEFKEHLGVLLISCLFIVLGSRLDVSQILALGWRGLAFLILLIAVIRPTSILIGLWRTNTTWKERLFLSFLAPRGIVAAAIASLFALKLQALSSAEPNLEIYADQAGQLVSITFLVIIGTVTFYGLAAAPLAKRLGLSNADPQGLVIAGGEPWVRELAAVLHKQGVPLILVDTNYHNISAARMLGLRASCASILSDSIHEQADLSSAGRLLALTSNDEINLLACSEYAHQFGRANVFQLPLNTKEAGNRTTVRLHLPGRVLFDGSLNAQSIKAKLNDGYEFRATTLTQEFGWEQFLSAHGPAAQPLFVLDTKRQLQIVSGELRKPPPPKHTIISLVRRKSTPSTKVPLPR